MSLSKSKYINIQTIVYLFLKCAVTLKGIGIYLQKIIKKLQALISLVWVEIEESKIKFI
jgi:hypothetical protein